MHIQALSYSWWENRRLLHWGAALTLLGWQCSVLVSPNPASCSLLSPGPTHVTPFLP